MAASDFLLGFESQEEYLIFAQNFPSSVFMPNFGELIHQFQSGSSRLTTTLSTNELWLDFQFNLGVDYSFFILGAFTELRDSLLMLFLRDSCFSLSILRSFYFSSRALMAFSSILIDYLMMPSSTFSLDWYGYFSYEDQGRSLDILRAELIGLRLAYDLSFCCSEAAGNILERIFSSSLGMQAAMALTSFVRR